MKKMNEVNRLNMYRISCMLYQAKKIPITINTNPVTANAEQVLR
jgi:hypothetical protein